MSHRTRLFRVVFQLPGEDEVTYRVLASTESAAQDHAMVYLNRTGAHPHQGFDADRTAEIDPKHLTGLVSAPPEYNLSGRELATVLAALRMFQNEYESNPDFASSMEHFEDHDPLDIEEVNQLCRRLNGDIG